MIPETIPFVVSLDPFVLSGELCLPPQCAGLVILVDGSGGHDDNRQQARVVERLHDNLLATLRLDLLTAEEGRGHHAQRRHPYDIELLAGRLAAATDEAHRHPRTQGLPIGYFATGSAASAALVAATERPSLVHAIVECSGILDGRAQSKGYLDLTTSTVKNVTAATRFIVPETDGRARAVHEMALVNLGVKDADLAFVPHASEAQADATAVLATQWFVRHLWSVPMSDAQPDARATTPAAV